MAATKWTPIPPRVPTTSAMPLVGWAWTTPRQCRSPVLDPGTLKHHHFHRCRCCWVPVCFSMFYWLSTGGLNHTLIWKALKWRWMVASNIRRTLLIPVMNSLAIFSESPFYHLRILSGCHTRIPLIISNETIFSNYYFIVLQSLYSIIKLTTRYLLNY